MKRKIVMKKLIVTSFLSIFIIGTCSTGFAASLDEEAAPDMDIEITEDTGSEIADLETDSIEDGELTDIDDTENVSVDEATDSEEQAIPDEADSEEEDESKIAFVNMLNNMDPDLYETAVNELKELDLEQIDQIEELWSENIFDEFGYEKVGYAYTSETGLSDKAALVLLLANIDMGMNYINEHYDGNETYLQDLNIAYEEICESMTEIACITKDNSQYVNILQECFAQKMEKIYDINWDEQKKEENPRLIYWIFKYYEDQCFVDAKNCMEIFEIEE